MSTAIEIQKKKPKEIIMWMVNILAPLIIMMIPTGEIFTKEIKIFIAITVFAILMFAFELVENAIPSLVLPVAYLVFGLAPNDVVFAAWSTSMPWMIISALIIVNVCSRHNLLNRIAYSCIIRTGASYKGIIYGIMLVGIIINLIIPGAALLPVIVLGVGICNALGLKHTPAATGIMFTSAMAAVVPWMCILSPNLPGVLANIVKQNYGIEIIYTSYMFHNLPVYLWCFFLAWLITKIYKPVQEIQGREFIAERLQKIGKISVAEKKIICLLICLMAYIVTVSIHKMDTGWGFLLIAAMMFMPGFKVGETSDIKTVDFSLVLFVTACMSIGSVSQVLGVGEIVANLAFPILEGKSVSFVIAIVWLLGVIANFLLTPIAAITAFADPLTNIAFSLNVDPQVIYYALLQGLEQYALPYEHFPYLLMMSFGLVKIVDFTKFFVLKMILNLVFVMMIALPFWRLIGLL